ncbi:MAG: hypothetical protein AAGD07_04950 [Planctomycetota bacterium]
MTDSAFDLGSKLEANAVTISTDRQPNRIAGEVELVRQSYLRVRGSPQGFRWLSALFAELAERASSDVGAGVILTPDVAAVSLKGWDKLDISCETDSNAHTDE